MAKLQKSCNSHKKQARKKYITQGLINHLVVNVPDSPLYRPYWDTWHCQSTLTIQDGKLHSYHCKNRWCLSCNAIRTAKLIQGYLPQIKEFSAPYFLTLTIPNCEPDYDTLKDSIKAMYQAIRGILNKYTIRQNKVKWLRKMECTISEKHGNFHPHFHFIVDGRVNATYIMNEWLRMFPDANEQAQDIRKADINSVVELFKYFTKVFVKNGEGKAVLPDAIKLDTIFCAIRGVRTFQASHNIKKVDDEIKDVDDICELVDAVYSWYQNDWINEETGEALTGYEPSERIKQLLEK